MPEIINLNFATEQYGGDMVFLKTILSMYLTYTPTILADIEKEIASRNIMAAKAATHKIKTDIMMMGISGVQDYYTLMSSQNAEHVDFEKTESYFATFKQRVTAGLNELKAELEKM